MNNTARLDHLYLTNEDVRVSAARFAETIRLDTASAGYFAILQECVKLDQADAQTPPDLAAARECFLRIAALATVAAVDVQRAAGFQPADQTLQNCQQDAGSTLAATH